MVDRRQHFPSVNTTAAEAHRALFITDLPGALRNTEYIKYFLGGSIAVFDPAFLITGAIAAEVGRDFVIEISEIS